MYDAVIPAKAGIQCCHSRMSLSGIQGMVFLDPRLRHAGMTPPASPGFLLLCECQAMNVFFELLFLLGTYLDIPEIVLGHFKTLAL